ncbi:hypothetical protein RF11_15430 [Thelohanellus kitauei]|uniref:CCHC-type domain-containing protein n=1 Tax=Thelohanellus kitauei TaxID=669202 RepID=A0A0C2IGI4_THEKT|nr:hypothetical protein RF11_15430 [Thelohanellus kitauei]
MANSVQKIYFHESAEISKLSAKQLMEGLSMPYCSQGFHKNEVYCLAHMSRCYSCNSLGHVLRMCDKNPKLNGREVNKLCDTGSNISCVDQDTLKTFKRSLKALEAKILGYMGNEMPISGRS